MPKVIILGGGVAGLSAAHELLHRGFDVEVYERNPIYVGGKARSIDYNHENQYKKPLPGEHGFRFFPGFYKHITATMKEIPYPEPSSSQNAFDNLTATSRILVARYGKKPIKLTASFPRSLKDLKLIFHTLHGSDSGLTDEEEEFFAERVWQLMSSCYARRDNDYERLSWWQFTQAARFSQAYRHLLVEGLTRTLVAAKAELASTRTGGDIFLQLLFCMTDPSVDTDRVLDGPTNDRWLTAWKEYLLSKNMKLTQGASATQVNMDNGKVKSVTISHQGKLFEVTGDYYLMAMPVEKAAPLINKDMIDIDARLQFIQQLAPSVAWMNGIQYYLTEDVKLNQGHILCSDTEWALTCISQVQFWKDYDITTKGNGNVKGVLSVDISDWFSPGKFTPINRLTNVREKRSGKKSGHSSKPT
ncbi:MAG: FAD-dependent oxidoreductase [Cyanobacteria bacterium J06638_22]